MKPCLQIPCLPLNQFHWNKDDKTLSAESSDFGPLRDGMWWLNQLWDDSADIGICVQSHHTDKQEFFYLHEEVKNQEGELLYFEFLPVKPGNVSKIIIFWD